jgi:hypothetical protein
MCSFDRLFVPHACLFRCQWPIGPIHPIRCCTSGILPGLADFYAVHLLRVSRVTLGAWMAPSWRLATIVKASALYSRHTQCASYGQTAQNRHPQTSQRRLMPEFQCLNASRGTGADKPLGHHVMSMILALKWYVSSNNKPAREKPPSRVTRAQHTCKGPG